MEIVDFELYIIGLVRDGADTWYATLSIPAMKLAWQHVTLRGATEEQAYMHAQHMIAAWYLRTRRLPASN